MSSTTYLGFGNIYGAASIRQCTFYCKENKVAKLTFGGHSSYFFDDFVLRGLCCKFW